MVTENFGKGNMFSGNTVWRVSNGLSQGQAGIEDMAGWGGSYPWPWT